uniref:Sulfotransferase n=1 Tax=Mola mola TaxID=94237 RepID=A0A3Q3XG04_MOLML
MIQYFTTNWEKIQNFQARPDDILIATYPKAGEGVGPFYFPLSRNEYERVPFLEIAFPSMDSGVDLAEMITTSPRLIKTHLPVQFVPKSFWEQNCKIIYVARNAKDNMVSYFHFDRMTLTQPDPGDWSSYFKRFLEGKSIFHTWFCCLILFGSWYDHVNSWWKKKQTHDKIHYMFYDDMIEDTGEEIEKLCCFFGLSPSVEEKKQIKGGVQFDNMKKNSMVNYSTFQVMDFNVSHFMRKGKVGDWKNHFTVAQNEEFDEDYRQKMKNSTLQFRWEV